MNLNLSEAASVGFHMPAEWQNHSQCWMAWPCREGFNSEATCLNYAEVAKTISRFEPVSMVVHPQDREAAQTVLGSQINCVEIPIDDGWFRDNGPNFLVNDRGDVAGACFGFNAWGGNYEPFEDDAQAAPRLMSTLGLQMFPSRMIAEGGGITVDGEGTLITTETCFLNPNRNPGWSKSEVEAELCRMLGVTKVIWIPGDPYEDETNGHVDGLAAFVGPGRVLVEAAFDGAHPRYDVLMENRRALEGQTDAKGRILDLIFIEDAWQCDEGERFCTSYINSYIANGAVIMPSYGLSADDRAKATYQQLFPRREIIPLRIDDIAPGGGGIHCITQQQPGPSAG
ncbi:MAG TPA: agmatine deiminase family protein [Gammaproteobacteria bacterium]|jgi:agmatine deiminase|nr:MAG: agmatine deiminase [Candidatus Endolissoclinum sp. TMED55]RPG01957.1 MAG: agmatine deiminase family protein [Proteobacteria bacterium TMED51]HAU42541.1 agmatine deiminase family protein [Gammaproteobacteria bacterium]|tara:strand:- start:7557 stop:8579 length:1023 start_codon:yes stop_codon:yes gene_type:complete